MWAEWALKGPWGGVVPEAPVTHRGPCASRWDGHEAGRRACHSPTPHSHDCSRTLTADHPEVLGRRACTSHVTAGGS